MEAERSSDLRAAVAARVVAQAPVAVRQSLDLRVPHLECGAERVREGNDRRVVAAGQVVEELDAVGIAQRHGFSFRVIPGLAKREPGTHKHTIQESDCGAACA